MRKAAVPLVALLAFAYGFAARAAGPVIPAPTGYVNDRAGAMGGWAEKTEALCRDIERATGAQVAVLTVRTTEGMAPQQYAQLVFDRWKIGKRGKDDGVLILVAVDRHRVRGGGSPPGRQGGRDPGPVHGPGVPPGKAR
jgi:uncharacterized protein